jgi:hypothetical protein
MEASKAVTGLHVNPIERGHFSVEVSKPRLRPLKSADTEFRHLCKAGLQSTHDYGFSRPRIAVHKGIAAVENQLFDSPAEL